jgi:hypothetical protein
LLRRYSCSHGLLPGTPRAPRLSATVEPEMVDSSQHKTDDNQAPYSRAGFGSSRGMGSLFRNRLQQRFSPFPPQFAFCHGRCESGLSGRKSINSPPKSAGVDQGRNQTSCSDSSHILIKMGRLLVNYTSEPRISHFGARCKRSCVVFTCLGAFLGGQRR